MKQIIVAGAGIWGSTIARVLAEVGWSVRVVESRGVVGGNVRCEIDSSTGIEIHTYGSHIFHTSIDEVWDFVNRFATFNGYQHKVMAKHEGELYFLPLGLQLVNQFYKTNLIPSQLEEFIKNESSSSSKVPTNAEEQAISFVGNSLYEAFIKNYTAKQWGTDPKNLPADIIKRLPVRSNYDVNYFSDYRQGVPLDGYNSLFERMLDHPNISIELNREFTLEDVEKSAPSVVFYSGPLDKLFSFKFGALPWRSLKFEVERVKKADVQGTSVVNYVDADVAFTRQHEYKHYHPENKEIMAYPETIICREYPKKWEQGDEPYYPVDNAESTELLSRYREEAAKYDNLIVGGRLGLYKYFDMDKSVASALRTAREFLNR